MKLSQLKIDPEFQSKIPPLQFEEEQQLEQNIIAEGRLLNPIITWNGYILDGHTRYRILKKHGFIKFEVEEIQLANKYEALAWICKNQLGRRNLSPERKKFLLGKEYESTKLAVGAPLGSKHGIRKCGQNDHIFTESRTCQRIASEHGVGEKTVRRAEKYSQGIDAAEEAVPGAQEEILTGHIKATDEQIVALASIPKEERPAILEELKKKKSDRDDTVLERLKPNRPPPKPKPAPQKKKPMATENNTASQEEQPETSVQAPITESPPEEEIEPTGNAPPSFLQSIQGHKRHLSEEDKARLQASVDARYQDKAAATGSIMLCELQGATEEFIFRWNVVFQEHPDVLTDKTCRKTIFELLDRMTNYLKTIFMLPNNWRYLRGNIYYADMEPHIGSEQGGKRPVVVLQNNIGNRHSPTLIVATVTTRTEKKKNQPTHVLVDSNPAFEEPSMILLEQIFTIDKSRIERFMGYASKAEMLRIDMALLVSLALNVLSGNRSE